MSQRWLLARLGSDPLAPIFRQTWVDSRSSPAAQNRTFGSGAQICRLKIWATLTKADAEKRAFVSF